MDPLPIDPLLPEVVSALRAGPALVVEAPPGAGKTTRLPPALLTAGLAGDGEVVVLEPRRLAARMAARRVAAELGERPGETVGWQVRFEDVSGPRTRLRYVTEALLTRRLLATPELPGVGAVVLDEFHERHLDGDLALALLARLAARRPDLKLVVMSATLDAGPVARFLGAPSLRSEGRAFPVELEHLSPEEAARDQRLEERVASAVRRALRDEPDGHVLVFLPGAAEIRRAREALSGLTLAEVLPLHGDLPPEEQDRAVGPSARRKVILSTNVAETSVTIEGVAAVVDSGLARVAAHSPWSGLPTLELRKVSRASAAQRAGRAGRTRAGRCLRLYTRHDHDARPEFDLPEIRREDLAGTALALAQLGVAAGEGFWLDAPPPAAWEAAHALLRDLGALDAAGRITALGRRLARFPLHPRLARLVVAAEEAGDGPGGALLAALLGERDIRAFEAGRLAGPGAPAPRRDVPTGPSDLLELASLFEEAARARFAEGALRRLRLAPGAVQAVERARRQLERLVQRRSTSTANSTATATATAAEEALLRATLAGFPDRVARRRAPGSDEVVLAGGGSARLAPESAVREAPLLVAVDAEERRVRVAGRPGAGGAVVRLASAVTQEMLLDLFPDALRYEEEVRWDATAERADGFERLVYRDLVLEEARAARVDPDRAAAALLEAARARGARSFAGEGALDRLLARLAFAARHAPDAGLPAPGEDGVEAALRAACVGRRSFAELREVGLEGALLGALAPPARALLERLAPERVTLPGGRSVKVEYEAGDKPPWIASRLQDFFGLADGPRLAQGRVPLVLHLLAPNGRAQQVTTDLAGFWSRHYPALRRELMRRYPRHAWPEDPLRAEPPQPRRR
ncbi:ATP-dependent RNA helicase [Anaeromyxobacter diazotrophicus]|uniref:ATP-dependent helicase HrpB n=1 Tax=Anaeromyxobacter diazotrophicus TaxID=2590199 RepID=A0A7I9VSG2_9BACT|nr:ATP-dependent helicase C-terminal domain-containing protein [Anaeromyxobacter diazotrophicus]GEJ59060.1 ATP-dependent helicase HrpB [Anaeromyxobacter diazotrophicus]